MQVISVTPTDPLVLAKLGELHDSEGDESQAYQYYCEVELYCLWTNLSCPHRLLRSALIISPSGTSPPTLT